MKVVALRIIAFIAEAYFIPNQIHCVARYLRDQLTAHYQRRGREVTLRYIDPSYFQGASWHQPDGRQRLRS